MGDIRETLPQIRLAILETDTPLPSIKARHGRFDAIFTTLLRAGCESFQPPQSLESQLTLSTHDVVTGDPATAYPDPDDIDAVLITGSKFSAYEDHDWIVRLVAYLRRLLAAGRVRVLGICFGHQIVARALGAPVGRSPGGWELAVTRLELTKEGKEVFGRQTLNIYQTHRDAVLKQPPGTVSLAWTQQCPVQSLYIPEQLLTVQGHPEFNEFIMCELLRARHGSGVFTDEMFEEAMGRARVPHDGVAIARAFLRFLHG